MPKDPPRNQPNYKIGGYHINEYEYQNNKGQITEEKENLYPRPKEKAEGADLMDESDDEMNSPGGENQQS